MQIRWSHSYSKTLNLPKSALPNRPDRAKVGARIASSSDDLYKWQLAQTQRPVKLFMDGPPYANGELHLGHAMNKILKDIINRANVLDGFRVKYVPGWDCHGLPIENASRKIAKSKKQPLDTIVQRRDHARKLALEMIEKQKQGFQSFGVMADWNDIYRTLDESYVVRQLRVFAGLMEKGLVYRQNKPVYWSCESRTALAEGELQYETVTSDAIYVRFPLVSGDGDLVIWTTTPWTIPSNRAISVAEGVDYAFVKTAQGTLVVAEKLLENVPQGEIIKIVKGSDLASLRYRCPITGEERPVIVASHVTDSSGTGLVHTAPGHGNEDYLAGLAHGLPAFCPVDGAGKYTDELHPEFGLVGQDARKVGNPTIIKLLEDRGALLAHSKLQHNVPFDWRSKTPVMIRATPQFFVDLSNVRQIALKALDGVKFNPESGRARLSAFIQSRTEWCVSRQRAWGVPLPVLYHKQTEEVLMSPKVVDSVIARIEAYGSEGLQKWFEPQEDVSEWLPDGLDGTKYQKGTDTMDVWFDSGTAWTQSSHQAEYYLEGSDQHRGWFQSSLLTHVATTEKPVAPFRNLITHGFTLDGKGQKMSKSLGNVVSPPELINGNKNFPALGVDGLRLLIAQTDYTSDVGLSSTVANQVASTIRKLRLTFKFLLGNLNGYTPTKVSLGPADEYTLHKLNEFVTAVRAAYEQQNFASVVKLINNHMNNQLSAFYFDVSKDVLYTDAENGSRRTAIQYVLGEILRVYLTAVCPITPLLTQEVWEYSPSFVTQGLPTPAMAGWPTLEHKGRVPHDFEKVLALKGCVNELIEKARSDKRVGTSLGCDVYLSSPVVAEVQDHMAELLIVSHVEFGSPRASEWSYTSEFQGVQVTITSPQAEKCPRCWQFTAPEPDKLCLKCDKIVHS